MGKAHVMNHSNLKSFVFQNQVSCQPVQQFKVHVKSKWTIFASAVCISDVFVHTFTKENYVLVIYGGQHY